VAPEIIKNGENGYIVKNLQEAEEKIRMLLSDDKLRETLSINARKSSEEFRSEILAENMMKLYAKILKKK
jgi:glycosyltransferase involved in cell wall biosynthesis